jgi:hypothetical protein
MTLCFTLCSNNYLAQAKVLGDSLVRHNPNYGFVIVLVDKKSNQIDYDFFRPHQVIPVAETEISEFSQMCERYDITELNTAVKPFVFHYLLQNNTDVDRVIYLDPDIKVYKPFSALEQALETFSIVVTPHFFTPIYDNYYISEPGILNAGLYNLGFLALKRSEEATALLQWWMIKLKDQCLIDFANGLFVDQLWMNFAPIYFNKVLIFRDLGYNVAYWNLHERVISQVGDEYYVNENIPLIFYHFSGYKFSKPEILSKYQNRYTFDKKPDVLPLFKEYHNGVMTSRFNEFWQVPCFYMKAKEAKKGPSKDSYPSIVKIGRYLKRKVKSSLIRPNT